MKKCTIMRLLLALCFALSSCSANSSEPAASAEALPAVSNPHAEGDFDGTVNALDISNASSDAEAEILSAADARRKSFFASRPEPAPSSGGTTYYISPGGNDSNDGLTPETAWATLEAAFGSEESRCISGGDIVLLERGGTWRVSPPSANHYGVTSDAYHIPDGVTVGAYGSGERPIIRGDIPGADNLDFWTLIHNENGAKIWAEEVMPFWSTSLNGWSAETGEPFDIVSALQEDLTFCTLLDSDRIAEVDLGQQHMQRHFIPSL